MIVSKLAPILMLLLMVQPLAAETHTFTDTQGRNLEGEMVSTKGDSVTIKRSDGKVFTVSVKTLSGEDQKYIKEKSRPAEVKGLWSKSVFLVNTIASSTPPIAHWIIFDSQTGNFEAGPDDVKAVIEHFKKQNSSRKKHGIFIHSVAYAVPDTPKERAFLTDYQRVIWRNPEWLQAEAVLIDDLKKECDVAGIALYVNTSADFEAPWKILVPEKQ